MNEFEVVGIVTGVSKKSGKTYTMLHLLRDFSESNSQSRYGQECITQYIDGNVSYDVQVGSHVKFEYTIGGNGYPVVCGVQAI
jgi:hypothetical protein